MNATATARSITLESTVFAAAGQVSRELEQEILILEVGEGRYYSLEDPVATRIWALLQDPITVAAIHEALVAEFEVDDDVCQSDLLNLLGELRAAGLIELRESAG